MNNSMTHIHCINQQCTNFVTKEKTNICVSSGRSKPSVFTFELKHLSVFIKCIDIPTPNDFDLYDNSKISQCCHCLLLLRSNRNNPLIICILTAEHQSTVVWVPLLLQKIGDIVILWETCHNILVCVIVLLLPFVCHMTMYTVGWYSGYESYCCSWLS